MSRQGKLLFAHVATSADHGGLVRYLVHRIPPGDFLLAVLSNDLMEAVSRGDDASVAGLRSLVRFLHNDTPWSAHGSLAIVRAWVEGVR
jgi:hypothetical protein